MKICTFLKVGGNVARYSVTGSAKKKTNIHNSEELIQKVWESVRSNNGIMVNIFYLLTVLIKQELNTNFNYKFFFLRFYFN